MEVGAVPVPPSCFWSRANRSTAAAEIQLSKNAVREFTKLRAFLCSSSIQDPRSKSWSDANLARELRDFMAAHELPSDKVPTMKELASKGRQDLANIVRRRGYKATAQLLAAIPATAASGELAEETTEPQPEKCVDLNGCARSEKTQQLKYLDLVQAPSPDSDSTILEKKAEKFLRTGEFSSDQDESLYTTEESDSENEALEMVALRRAALLRSKLTPFMSSRDQEAQVSQKLSATSNKVQELLEKDKELQSQSKGQDAVDPEDPKALLELREKELKVLARELGEAKAQLALVQAKATAELSQAKQVFMEKDLRLSSAEHALANLKQVKIEWWGAASKVELAGSFNGWEHFFVLEPDLSSEIVKPDGARGPLMWETELWLYPGVYEMKFIVDGEWRIDHRREVFMKGMNQNNVLRVDF